MVLNRDIHSHMFVLFQNYVQKEPYMQTQDREVFKDFLERVIKRFQCSSGSITLYNGESRIFKVVASKGLKLERLEKGIDTREGVTGLICRNKRTVLIDNEHPLPPYFSYRRERELCSICLPLIDSEKKVIGILSLNKRRGIFSSSKVILLKLLAQEISALAEQMHLRKEEEKVTLSLQDGFTRLLQDSTLADIDVLLQKIAEISLNHAGAQFSVFHAPLFATAPVLHPAKIISSSFWWNECQKFLSPYIKEVWKDNAPQCLQIESMTHPFLQEYFSTGENNVIIEIYPVTHNQKSLGVLLLFLKKPLSQYHRISLILLLSLGGVLLQNHLLLRETEVLVRRQEQLKLAQELHNNLTQDLAGIQLYIEALKGKIVCKPFEPREASLTLRKIDLVLRRCLDYSRNVLKTLQKSVDEKRPFHEKIIEVLEQRLLFVKKKPRYNLKVNLPDYVLSRETQEVFLQLVVEAANNTLKHAQAKQIWIKIGTWKDKIYFLFRDDGKGFDIQNLPSAHGLSFLKQQILIKQGFLRVSSSRGKGTTVKAVLPIYG
ncbi:MAG: GAF domain-containing protein, partial [Atribacterota bacterium]|nr:GAF domain-containing protein [Atribacterota bacterium]